MSNNKSSSPPPPPPPPPDVEQQETTTEIVAASEAKEVIDVDQDGSAETVAESEEREDEEEGVTYASTGGVMQKTPPAGGREESGSAVVAKHLAPQLGSSPRILGRQQIDERKMAVLNDLTQTSLGYFAYRGKVDKVRFFRWISNWELVSSQAVGGLARRHILQAISASSGVTVSEVAGRPNIFARNITQRNWKERAVRDGKVVVDE